MQDITGEEFAELLELKVEIQLLDVREKIEFYTFNVGGLNIPLGELAGILEDEDLDFNTQRPLIVLCQHGLRSRTAKLLLQAAGFNQSRNLLGGLVKFQRLT